jgi:regulator of protease activity HflC (stomatin/prohibitin superfamily)
MYGPVRAAIRDEAAKYSAEEFYHSERIDIAGDISNEIRDNLAARGIIIEGVYLRYTKLPDDYMNAVNAKMISSQQVEKLDYDVMSAQKQANITRINADAEAYKNRAITDSSSDYSIASKYIDGITKPTDKTVIYIPVDNNGVPIFTKSV